MREAVKKSLLDKGYDASKVAVFVQYLKELHEEKNKQGQLKNRWAKNVTDEQYVTIYEKVAIDDPLYIDGETITLNYRGKLKVTYDYQAYKNKLLVVHPESVLDFQLVYKDDTFAFSKQSGKVTYSHKIANPFDTKKEIIGAYGVVKNSRGEFIEFLTLDDIKKMRAVAQTDNVWKTWFDRMVLKSVIKRSCRVHFFESFKNIEELDNENYDLGKVEQTDKEDVYATLEKFTDVQELLDWAAHPARS